MNDNASFPTAVQFWPAVAQRWAAAESGKKKHSACSTELNNVCARV